MEKGINRDKAVLHAIGSGAISGGIESITGIGASGASKALASKAGQKLLSIVPKKVASYISKASNSVIGGIFKNAIGESFEEGLEYDVQRIYQNLVLDENTPRDIKEQAYSMMIGGAVGGLFDGGKALLNKKPSLPYYKPAESKKPSLPNLNKAPSLPNMNQGTITEQTFESKNVSNNVDNGNVISQEEVKEPLKSNLETNSVIFDNQIEQWQNGEFNKNNHLILLEETPKVYQQLGIKNNPITVTSNKLERIVNNDGKQNRQYHGLGIDLVKQLPTALKNPLNVLKSHNNSIVVVTNLADPKGNIIIASVLVDGKGNIENIEVSSNVLTSAYGKENYDNYMERNINDGNLLYDIDEGMKKEFNTPQGLQLSNESKTPNNTKISQSNTNVNNIISQNKHDDTKNFKDLGTDTYNPDTYENILNRYGAIEPGEKADRIIDVPKSIDGETKVRQFTHTAMEIKFQSTLLRKERLS